MGKKKVTLSLDADVYDSFNQYCKDNAIMISKKIEIWIADFMKNSDDENKQAGSIKNTKYLGI